LRDQRQLYQKQALAAQEADLTMLCWQGG